MEKAPWHCQEPDFSFLLSLLLPELLCILCYFWNKLVFFFFLRTLGSHHPWLSLCSLCLQFAGEIIANLKHRSLVHTPLQKTRFIQSVTTLTSLDSKQHHKALFCRWLSTCSEALSPWAPCRIEPLMRHAFCTLCQSKPLLAKYKAGRQEPDTAQLEDSFETCVLCCGHWHHQIFHSREYGIPWVLQASHEEQSVGSFCCLNCILGVLRLF